MAHAVVFATQDQLGVGLQHGYVRQGIEHIMHAITQIRLGGEVADMLQITFRWWQHFAGIQQSIFEDLDKALSYVPGPWIHTIRNFLRDTKTKLRLLDMPDNTPPRENDECIMDLAYKAKFTHQELDDTNRCRLYL